jgi:hypothetical protein
VRGYYQGTTNIRRLLVYYSIKNKKFIRGYISGTRISGSIIYRLYEGTYIRFNAEYWSKSDPPYQLEACLVKIKCPDNRMTIENVACAVIKYRNPRWLMQNPQILPQFFDFASAIPAYHRYPSIDFDRVYSEEEHNKLIEFIQKCMYIVEGEENE